MENDKVICVPKDVNIQERLDFDLAKEDELIELKLSLDEFYLLWENNIFEIINEIGKVHIDDFESEEIIEQEAIRAVSKTLLELNTLTTNMELGRLLKLIISLFLEADERKTGVYFYF